MFTELAEVVDCWWAVPRAGKLEVEVRKRLSVVYRQIWYELVFVEDLELLIGFQYDFGAQMAVEYWIEVGDWVLLV